MNEYNWDNLEVGRYDLNHSENFFVFKHSKHEKLGLDPEIETLMDEEDAKENCSGALNEQNVGDPLDCYKDCANLSEKKPLKPSNHEQEKSIKLVKESSKGEIISKSNQQVLSQINNDKQICKSSSEKMLNSVLNKNALKSSSFNVKLPSNLLQQPVKSWSNLAVQNKEKPPNVLKYLEIYEKKKQNMLKKQMEDERKNRVFHSRPAPNFNAFHGFVSRKRQIEIEITTPITPRVLKNSSNAIERAKKLEELKKRSPPKYHHAREAKVLNESPFQPKKENRIIEMHPFNLHVEKRLNERKHFDEKFQKQMEEKRRKEEQERIKREEELSREFRKMTTFKARPNPFK